MDIKKNEEIIVAMVKRLFESSYSLSKGPCVMIIPTVIQ